MTVRFHLLLLFLWIASCFHFSHAFAGINMIELSPPSSSSSSSFGSNTNGNSRGPKFQKSFNFGTTNNNDKKYASLSLLTPCRTSSSVVTRQRMTSSSSSSSEGENTGLMSTTSSPKLASTTKNENVDKNKEMHQPYRGPKIPEALPEIFIPSILPHENNHKSDNQDGIDEELLWVPQTDTVSFRPLCFSVSCGYYVNLLRVRSSGMLSRHYHSGPVHGYVLKGKWYYLEHDWTAQKGSYIFEPPGETHTLMVPSDVTEMITMFHVTGTLLYCDVDGKVVGKDDVFTKLQKAKEYYASIGLGEDFVQQFVR